MRKTMDIEGMITHITFTNHADERFARFGTVTMDEQDVIDTLHASIDDEPVIWYIQDYLEIGKEKTMILINESNHSSIVINVMFDEIFNELNIAIITVWSGLDIRHGKDQLVFKVA